ncbi:hypothetical protein EMGBD2_15420 [Nitrospirota bacterium]|nr:hypothetical protein EMGBD2_15420 [Nitrospirota bacterium]
MMVNRGTEGVLSGNPDIDEILVLDKGSVAVQWRLIVELRRRRFDTVLDLTDGDRSAFLSWISGQRSGLASTTSIVGEGSVTQPSSRLSPACGIELTEIWLR